MAGYYKCYCYKWFWGCIYYCYYYIYCIYYLCYAYTNIFKWLL